MNLTQAIDHVFGSKLAFPISRLNQETGERIQTGEGYNVSINNLDKKSYIFAEDPSLAISMAFIANELSKSPIIQLDEETTLSLNTSFNGNQFWRYGTTENNLQNMKLSDEERNALIALGLLKDNVPF